MNTIHSPKYPIMETRSLYCLCLRCLGSCLGFVASLGYQRDDSYLTWPQVLPFRRFRVNRNG